MSYLEQIENINSNLVNFNIEELKKSEYQLDEISHILFTGFKKDPELKKLAKPLKKCWISVMHQIDIKNKIKSEEKQKKILETEFKRLDKYFKNLDGMATYCTYFPEESDYFESVKEVIENHCEKYSQIKKVLPNIEVDKTEKPLILIEFTKNNCSSEAYQIISDRFY